MSIGWRLRGWLISEIINLKLLRCSSSKRRSLRTIFCRRLGFGKDSFRLRCFALFAAVCTQL